MSRFAIVFWALILLCFGFAMFCFGTIAWVIGHAFDVFRDIALSVFHSS